MISEQREQWQKAVMRAYPVPTADGQECTLEQWQEHRRAESAMLTLLPKNERFEFVKSSVKIEAEHLADANLPDWVLTIRNACALASISFRDAETAFLSDVALIGMQLRYPTLEARTEAYKRLLVSFLPRVLRPLVEHTEANQDTDLRHDLEGYFQICQLCESDGLYNSPQCWLDIQNNFGPGMRRRSSNTRAPRLVVGFVRLARQVLFQIEESTSERWLMTADTLMFYFTEEHYSAGLKGYFIGRDFLDALEAECPLPDWLQLT